jgi:hypothetical protein
MTDKEINDFFIKNMNMLEKIAKGIAFKQNKKYIHHSTAVNEAYLYIFEKNRNNFNNEDELQRMVINYIKMMTIWNGSVSFTHLEKTMTSDYIPDTIDDFEDNLESKLEIEFWYNDKKCLLQMYRDQENDRVKQIIFDCYFNKNITKGIDMAKHLKINKDYSCKYIREMKRDIREFAKKINDNNGNGLST